MWLSDCKVIGLTHFEDIHIKALCDNSKRGHPWKRLRLLNNVYDMWCSGLRRNYGNPEVVGLSITGGKNMSLGQRLSGQSYISHHHTFHTTQDIIMLMNATQFILSLPFILKFYFYFD